MLSLHLVGGVHESQDVVSRIDALSGTHIGLQKIAVTGVGQTIYQYGVIRAPLNFELNIRYTRLLTRDRLVG